MRHRVSTLVRGRAVSGVSAISTAVCGTVTPLRESNWQNSHHCDGDI